MNQKISDIEREWLGTLEKVIQEHIADSQFNTTALAEKLSLSRSQLYRRLKGITGQTPSEYLQEARLQKAYELFKNKTYNSVKAVALSTGFVHRSSFANQFKRRFGKLPSEFLN